MAGTQIPLNITSAGPIPTAPTVLLSQLLTSVAAQQPGYTANLPLSMIEDISSTDVGALSMIDQMRVDAINALPITANPFLATLLGQQAGIAQGLPTNTSVNVSFQDTSFPNSVGFVIPAGFIVSDGSHQYVTQDGTVIGANGFSGTVTAIANTSGSWAVPANSVNQIVTSIPSPFAISVTNNVAGTPGGPAETLESYQSRVVAANQAGAVGWIQYLQTQLLQVAGVVPRLINVLQVASGTVTGWKVLVGGGDVYQVANAIFLSLTDITRLVGSNTPSRNVTVTLQYPPNSYQLEYLNPPLQVVTGTITWNTNLPNFTAAAQVNSLGAAAMVAYINSIQQGQPINLNQMLASFQDAVAAVLPTANLTTWQAAIQINGVLTAPNAGTQIIPGDPESYFNSAPNGFLVVQ
jgi:hypothetical protein